MADLSNEILCVRGSGIHYAIEFDYVEELCQELKITPVPALPDYYCGMGNYKGKIIPVLRLDDRKENEITIVIRWDCYLIGVEASAEVFIATQDMVQVIEASQAVDIERLWKEKRLLKVDDRLYSLIDVESTIESLVLYP